MHSKSLPLTLFHWIKMNVFAVPRSRHRECDDQKGKRINKTRVYAQHQTLATIVDSAETDKKEIRLALFIELFMRGLVFCPHDSHTRTRTRPSGIYWNFYFSFSIAFAFKYYFRSSTLVGFSRRPGAVVVVVMCGCVSSFDFASIILLFLKLQPIYF